MDLWQKVDLLGGAAQYDTCQGCGTHAHRTRDDIGRWIYPAVRPDGTRVRLLKVLQSHVCETIAPIAHTAAGAIFPVPPLAPTSWRAPLTNWCDATKQKVCFSARGCVAAWSAPPNACWPP